MLTYTIGIDIGGSSTQLALVNKRGNIVKRSSFKTCSYHCSAKEYVSELCASIHQLFSSSDLREEILGIGIGAPNSNYYTGAINSSVNLPWREELPLAKLLQDVFHLPVVVTNDANATALGEMTYGAARGMSEFYLITLGTGVGSGIVANGKLLYGYDGKAGELGHLIIYPRGRKCGCGRSGCFEAYCSAGGVVKTAIELLDQSKDTISKLRNRPYGELTAKEIYDLAQRGDEIALETFRITGKILGETLANIATFSSPEAIILFGGVTHAWNLLEQPMQESFDAQCLYAIHRPKILLSALPNDEAALLGAAALPYQTIKSL